MSIFSKFKKKPKKTPVTSVTDLAKIVGPLLDNLANDIFVTYRDILISEPITYIVPAVWGAAHDKSLSTEQIGINEKVVPVIQQVFQILQFENLKEDQSFAIGFIIRGLIISKITYMIEALKNKLMSIDMNQRDMLIRTIEPIGHA